MKKLAINFLKSADEKLRNLGKSSNQAGTVDQSQNFTFVRHQQPASHSLQQPQQQHRQQKIDQEEEKQQQQQFQRLRRSEDPSDEKLQSTPLEHQHLQHRQRQQQLRARFFQEADDSDNINNMSERATRFAKRERNKTHVQRSSEEAEMARRRSRSEGPIRRVRQSMDQRTDTRKQENVDYSLDSDSDDGGYLPKARVESDSESDHQKWVKNPLVVRRVKKSEKNASLKKRHSITDCRQGSSSRNSLVISGKGDDQGSSGGDNSSRTGTGNRNSQKFQKLEELRKKRINLSVTSDEENTPASRISRLRQRAIQSGLGDQPRPVSNQGISPGWGISGDGNKVQQSPKVAISPYTASGDGPLNFGTRDIIKQTQTPQQYQKQGNNIIPSSVNRFSIPSQSQQQKLVVASNESSVHQSPQKSPIHNMYPVQNNLKRDYNMPVQSVQQAPIQKMTSIPFNSSPKPNHPVFHTVPDHHAHASRSLYNSSPEVNNRRYMSQVRVPSADSVLKMSPYPGGQNTYDVKEKESVTNITSPFLYQTNIRLGNQLDQQQQQQKSFSNPSLSKYTQPSLSSDASPQRKAYRNIVYKTQASQLSEDSLDELIESNIQYLDREIDKSRLKRLTNNSAKDGQKATKDLTSITSAISPNTLYTQNQQQFPSHRPLDAAGQKDSSGQLYFSSGNHLQIQRLHAAKSPVIGSVQQTPGRLEGSTDVTNSRSLRNLQPDVVPAAEWKLYESTRRFLRPGSEYFDKEDLSKSDSHLNLPLEAPSCLRLSHPPDRAYARGCVSDVNLTSESGVEDPRLEKGMFSDVDYDIEVCERVKKWEKYIKKPDNEGATKAINLTSIQEKQEGEEALMLPSEIRKSVLLRKKEDSLHGFDEKSEDNFSLSDKSPILETSVMTRVQFSPKITSVKPNTHRLLNVPQNSLNASRLGLESHSMTSVFQPPASVEMDKHASNSSTELRPLHLLTQSPNSMAGQELVTANNMHYQQLTPQNIGYSSQSQDESTPVAVMASRISNTRQPEQRSSRYQEELDEISRAKDSVVNLRRRFDPESGHMTSEDDQQSVTSVASAKLVRPTNFLTTEKDQECVDLSRMIPGYETRIKDSEFWSPNLESTTGVPVSIERVKARTLQTIPFSEDPFWKEIEEMTSFDPKSMNCHLSFSDAQNNEVVIKPQHSDLTSSSHSSTLPSQSRQSVSTRDRLQRSKSLYTPNITPLSINIEKPKAHLPNALDDVLDDIRTSMERQQQLSPKKRGLEKNVWSSVDSNPGYKVDGGQITFANRFSDIQPQLAPKLEPRSIKQMRAEQPALPSKQPLQFYQQQRNQMLNEPQQQQQQQQNKPTQFMPGSVNNYHLDPDLLKQKLLKTGLVVESDTEEMASSPSHIKDQLMITDKAPSRRLPASTAVTFQPTISSLSAPISRKQSFLSTSGVQSSANALEDIQRALDNFKSSPYQSGSDSMYSTFKSEPPQISGMDTTRGFNTKSTGWTYQSQPKPERTNKQVQPFVFQSQKPIDKEETNQGLDNLAQNVETQIKAIKTKLHSADENSLDGILSSLKHFTPDSQISQETPSSFNEYFNRKKSKLSNVLSELDRIHASLDLKQYSRNPNDSSLIPPQPKSEHLRPMQMRISSMYIPGLSSDTNNTSDTVDKEVESEFEVISKSFQAIIDDVNKTSNILKQNNLDMIDKAEAKDDKTKQDAKEIVSTDSESQTKTLKITLQNNEERQATPTTTTTSTTTSTISTTNVSDTPLKKSVPVTAPKPQLTKVSRNRFGSKIVDTSVEDPNVKKIRSKSVPELELGSTIDSGSTEPPQNEVGDSENNKPVPKAKPTATVSTPPPSRSRNRARPVKDNKIIQEDRASRKSASNRVLGMPPSPHQSPMLSRKIVDEIDNNLDVKIEPPTMFQDSKDEIIIVDRIIETKEATNEKSNIELQPSIPTVTPSKEPSTAVGVSKIPVAKPAKPAKPANTGAGNFQSPVSKITLSSPSNVSSISEKQPPTKSPTVVKTNLKVNLSNTKEDKSITSSSESNVCSPSVTETSEQKSDLAKQEIPKQPDHSAPTPSSKGKKTVKSNVALMRGKFQSSDGEGSPKIGIKKNNQAPPVNIARTKNKQTNNEGASQPVPEKKKVEPTLTENTVKSSVSNTQSEKTTLAISDAEKNDVDLNRKVSGKSRSPTPSSPNKPPARSSSKLQQQPALKKETLPSTSQKTSSGKVIEKDPEKPIKWHKTYETPKATKKSINLKQVNSNSKAVGIKVIGQESSDTDRKSSETKKKPLFTSPKLVRRRVRPTHRKIQTESTGSSSEDSYKYRPHSFHEFTSNPPADTNCQSDGSELRKYSSAEGLVLDPSEYKDFRLQQANGNVGLKQDGDPVAAVLTFDLNTKVQNVTAQE